MHTSVVQRATCDLSAQDPSTHRHRYGMVLGQGALAVDVDVFQTRDGSNAKCHDTAACTATLTWFPVYVLSVIRVLNETHRNMCTRTSQTFSHHPRAEMQRNAAIFTARRVRIARTMPWQDVSPSVTRRYSVETAKHINKLFHCWVAGPF